MGSWHLAFRALTSQPWSEIRDNLEHYLVRDEKAGEGEEGIYCSSSLSSFHSLVSHDGSDRAQAPALMMQVRALASPPACPPSAMWSSS